MFDHTTVSVSLQGGLTELKVNSRMELPRYSLKVANRFSHFLFSWIILSLINGNGLNTAKVGDLKKVLNNFKSDLKLLQHIKHRDDKKYFNFF